MPSRGICLGIVLFWLGFNGWLFFTDLLPRLLPGQPPPYTIDLVEETRTRRPHINWIVYHENELVFRARTEVGHPDHDLFDLAAEFYPQAGAPPVPIHGILIKRMKSYYRVNANGDLLGLSVEIEGSPQFAQVLKLIGADFVASIDGEVSAGHLSPQLTLRMPGVEKKRELPPVQIPRGCSVLLPLHPLNRIQGLREGQSWTIRIFDPLADSLQALQGSVGELRLLRARVRPRSEAFDWGRRRGTECLVVDYDGDNFKGSTWVSKQRGLVLAQEAILDNQRWTMYRD